MMKYIFLFFLLLTYTSFASDLDLVHLGKLQQNVKDSSELIKPILKYLIKHNDKLLNLKERYQLFGWILCKNVEFENAFLNEHDLEVYFLEKTSNLDPPPIVYGGPVNNLTELIRNEEDLILAMATLWFEIHNMKDKLPKLYQHFSWIKQSKKPRKKTKAFSLFSKN